MKNVMQMSIVILVILLSIAKVPVLVQAEPNIPAATSDFYVNDFVGIFSNEEKAQLMKQAVGTAKSKSGIQVVISVVKSLDGETVKDYAFKMYNKYGIGKDSRGILILIATGDRKIRVEVGKGMEGYFNDSKVGRFIDNYAASYLSGNKFNVAIVNLQSEMIKEIQKVEVTEGVAQSSTPKESIPINWGEIILWLLCLVFLGCIVLIAVIIRRKNQKIISLGGEIETYQGEIKTLQGEIDAFADEKEDIISDANDQMEELRQKNVKISDENKELNEKFNILNDRYKRANVLFPTADKDVSDMIKKEIQQKDMAAAGVVNVALKSVITLEPGIKYISDFRDALTRYQSLNDAQKSYVTVDAKVVEGLYNSSLVLEHKLLASEAAEAVAVLICGISIAKENDLSNLKKAKRVIEELNANVFTYFDKNIVKNVETLLGQAERDKKRREDDEERIRREQEAIATAASFAIMSSSSDNSSYSNNNDNTSYSGFGGESGGGGADREF